VDAPIELEAASPQERADPPAFRATIVAFGSLHVTVARDSTTSARPRA
jgi:hypothetical protein